MSADNMDLVRNFIEGVWNHKDLSIIEEYIHPDHVNHDPMEGTFPQGIEGVRSFVSTFISAFPDVHASIDSIAAEDDIVEATTTYRGTHGGELMGIPATGRKVAVTVYNTDRIENGMIVESWAEWDPQDLMQQLGVG